MPGLKALTRSSRVVSAMDYNRYKAFANMFSEGDIVIISENAVVSIDASPEGISAYPDFWKGPNIGEIIEKYNIGCQIEIGEYIIFVDYVDLTLAFTKG